MKPIRLLSLALCAAALACASPAAAQGTAAAADEQSERPARRDRNALTAEEIQSVTQTNLFEVVRSLRPQWLRVRGNNSISAGDPVQVYLDGMRLGGPEAMQSINPATVLRARFLSGTAATTQFGTDHSRGAILLFTREER